MPADHSAHHVSGIVASHMPKRDQIIAYLEAAIMVLDADGQDLPAIHIATALEIYRRKPAYP